MGDRDEFDNDNDAPLPPHERIWRHPAEVHDARRREHALHSVPPPIGRRATLLVVLVSLAASVALLAVTVPKGLDHRNVATADTVATTTSTVVTKGSASVLHAVRLSDRWLLAAPVNGDVEHFEVYGEGTVHVDAIYPAPTGTYVLASTSPAVSTESDPSYLTDDELSYLLNGEALHVVDIHGNWFGARWSAALRGSDATPHPIDVDGEFRGPGVLLTPEGETIGVVVRHSHRTVLHLWDAVVADLSGNGA